MSEGEIVLYNTEDGLARVQLRTANGTVWLTQAQMAELFATTRPNITQHLTAIFKSGECEEAAVCKQDLLTAVDGKRYRTNLYRLEAILAVGYRVRSVRGVQFRQWATTRLQSWKGGKVRKGDVDTAKNYLNADEVSDLNRIVTMFLDFAEDQAKRRKPMPWPSGRNVSTLS